MDQFDLSEVTNMASQAMFSPISEIYIDLQYLQDLRLGALLQMHFHQEGYQYILSQLPTYNQRQDRGHASYFPELGTTDEELERYIADPANTERLLLCSPYTDLYQRLPAMARAIQETNHRLGKVRRLTFALNVYPLTVPKELQLLLKSRILHIDAGASLGLIGKPAAKLKLETYARYHMAAVYDPIAFTAEETNSYIAMFHRFSLQNVQLIIPRRVDDPVRIPDTEREQVFKNTLAMLNLYCNPCYLDPKIEMAPATSSTEEVSDG